jgi:hypothetical protein
MSPGSVPGISTGKSHCRTAGTGLRMSELFGLKWETSTSLESRLAPRDLLSNGHSAGAKQKHPKSRSHSIHV